MLTLFNRADTLRMALSPLQIAAGVTVRLLIVGTGNAAMVTDPEDVQPPWLTLTLYVPLLLTMIDWVVGVPDTDHE